MGTARTHVRLLAMLAVPALVLVMHRQPACAADPSYSQVFLYEHTSYGGASLSFTYDQDVADLTKWRLPNSKKNWNDVISSLKVGKFAKITLYQHINYGGNFVTITADGQNVKNQPNLHSIGWGDYVSSFRVRMNEYGQ